MKKKSTSPELHEVAQRIAHLCSELWDGSQSAMSCDTDIRQGSLSNVLTGKREPGGAIISKIAKHPAVNAEWLLTGAGVPLLEHKTVSRVGDASLPVLSVPFAGFPQDNIDSLKTHQYPVHWSMYRKSRYWVEVGESHPLLSMGISGLVSGDRVLFESDRTAWPDEITGHPYIHWSGRGKPRKLVFGIAEHTYKKESSSGSGGQQQRAIYIDIESFLKPLESESVKSSPPELESAKSTSIVALGIYRCGNFGEPTND